MRICKSLTEGLHEVRPCLSWNQPCLEVALGAPLGTRPASSLTTTQGFPPNLLSLWGPVCVPPTLHLLMQPENKLPRSTRIKARVVSVLSALRDPVVSVRVRWDWARGPVCACVECVCVSREHLDIPVCESAQRTSGYLCVCGVSVLCRGSGPQGPWPGAVMGRTLTCW